jgi:hypothetical protein
MTSRVVYGWKDSRSFKVPAQVVGEVLEQIEAARGEITPRAVVEEARPVKSPIHSFFEWDDSKAADKYRDEQARALVACVVVRALDGAESKSAPRAFVSLSSDDGRSYLGIVSAMSDSEKRAQILSRARKEIEEWRDRYRALEEFSRLFKVIDKLAVKEPSRRRRSTPAAASAGLV